MSYLTYNQIKSLIVWAIAEGRSAAAGVDNYLMGEKRTYQVPFSPLFNSRRLHGCTTAWTSVPLCPAGTLEECAGGTITRM